jgi:hypothetical protein
MDKFADLRLAIAKNIGEPINPNLPVPVELSEIANIDTANPGEKVYRFDDIDTRVDTILAVAADGSITQVKVSPLGDTEISFSHLNSEMLYVLVADVLDSIDLDVLGRKKSRITEGLNKRELKIILDALLTRSALGETDIIEMASGSDLYDVILNAKHELEDYGDNFVLLEGTLVKEAIDSWDKDKASTYNYNLTLRKQISEWGIKELKIFGQVATTSGGSGVDLLDKTKFILIAKNSRIAKDKPITFVRRKISPEIARLMGADVDNAQRALWIGNTPVNVAGTDTLAFSVYGYESYVMAIVNPYAVCVSDDLSSIL